MTKVASDKAVKVSNKNNSNNQKASNMTKAVKEVETVQTIEDKILNLDLTNYHEVRGFLDTISQKEFDGMSIEDKQKIFEVLFKFNDLNLTYHDEQKSDKVYYSDLSKNAASNMKDSKTLGKEFSNKFGKIESLTKQDFVIWSYLNWNSPKNVIATAMQIFDINVKATWTTINAFAGQNDTNKNFLERMSQYNMAIAKAPIDNTTFKGSKVYKISVEKITDDKLLKQVLKLQKVTIQDFQNQNAIELKRLEKIEQEKLANASKVEEVEHEDDGLEIVQF